MSITPEQCHAARILACIDEALLSAQSGVPVSSIAAFEKFGTLIAGADSNVLQHALEELGIDFIAEDANGGAGVRLKFDRGQTSELADWESEGGTAADDDVP